MYRKVPFQCCAGGASVMIIASFNKTRCEEMRNTFSEPLMKEFRLGILFGLNTAHFNVVH